MKKEDYEDLDALIPTGQETPDDPFGPNAVIPLNFPQTVEEDQEKAYSNVTIMPSMKLTWHSVCARPNEEIKEEKSIFGTIFETLGIYKSNDAATTRKHIPRRLILNHCFGAAYPGEVLALMGASGAGKTTLMNVLTQRNLDTVTTSGTIKINDVEVGQSTLRKLSAYAQQDDLFISTMTVKEHLNFTALMKMGKHYSSRQREKRVHLVMEDLALTKCQDTLIGSAHRGIKGISGGERKRLSFASEIMTSPPLLFCDEPTSGLDSFMAKQTIQVLKELALRKNMTIIVTIHQPSSFLFSLFDRVCLMGEGRTAFLGTISEARWFWKSLDDPVPEKSNPADHFISSLAIKVGEEDESRKYVSHVSDSFIKSRLGQELNRIAIGEDPSSSSSSLSSKSSQSLSNDIWQDNAALKEKTFQRYKASWWQQFWGLLKRSFIGNLRHPVVLHVRIFQTIVISIILASVYYDTKISQTTIMNVNGNLFQAVMNTNFMFQFTAVNLFCEELPIFLRENQANMYRVTPYFLSKNISEGVQFIIYPFIYAAIVYWFSGLVQDFVAFLIFSLVCVLITNVGISISYMMSCIFGTVGVAISVMPVIVIPLMAFGGYYINIDTLPIYFMPLKYISYFAYGYEILAVNEWSRIGKIEGCLSNTTKCYSTGKDVIDSLGFKESHLWPDIIILASMILIFRLIAFIALWIRAETKK